MKDTFGFQQLVDLCRLTHEEMQSRASRSVDSSLVVRNWLFGWYIVEYEQKGFDRAKYGKSTLKKLSKSLQEAIGRGFSVDSLEQMRRFFTAYRGILPTAGKSETMFRISETVSRISQSATEDSSIILSSITSCEMSTLLASSRASRRIIRTTSFVTLTA